jgi:hypothetical protein
MSDRTLLLGGAERKHTPAGGRSLMRLAHPSNVENRRN